MRLRQIDMLGIQYGAEVALELAAARPELVRRLVLAGVPNPERLVSLKQQRLMISAADYGGDANHAAAPALARQISAFLRGRS